MLGAAQSFGLSPPQQSERVFPASGKTVLHLAVLGVGVLVVGETGGDDVVGQHVAFLDHLAHVEVLDRVLVGVELASRLLSIGLPIDF